MNNVIPGGGRTDLKSTWCQHDMVALLVLLDHTGIISPASLSPIQSWGNKTARRFYQFVSQCVNLPLHLHCELVHSSIESTYLQITFIFPDSIDVYLVHIESTISDATRWNRWNPMGFPTPWKILRRRDGSDRISTTGFIKTAWRFLRVYGQFLAKGRNGNMKKNREMGMNLGNL